MKIISQSAGTDNAQQLRWVQIIYIQTVLLLVEDLVEMEGLTGVSELQQHPVRGQRELLTL